MLRSEVEIGGEYAVREPTRPGVPFQRVRVLERVRAGKWRVEWLEPNPGLVDFVKSTNLIVEWRSRKRFLDNEQRHLTLAE
jgi:hypothetical protein